MTFLDLMTNMTGAVMILMLFALKEGQKKPCPSIAHQGKVYYDRSSGKVFGDLAPSAAPVEESDSVLVVVSGLQPFPQPGDGCPPCPPSGSARCARTHCDDPNCSKNPEPKGECSIALSTQVSGCQGNDQYSVRLWVTKAGGSCATTWTDGSGRAWPYETEVILGPYPIAQGGRSISVWDSQQPSLRRSAAISPPPKCSGGGPAAGSGGPTVVQVSKVGYVPPGRRVILFWENEASNLDIVVEKENSGRIRGNQNDKPWGEWYRDKSKWMGRRSTEEGVKFYATGAYKVYAKNKTGRSGPASQKVTLALTNSLGARESIEHGFDIPRDADEVWLAD
ncbi:MAG TPA: hypothetical protein PK858_12875, partial [Saprospiraceae bacterium]|nr:hypothetical protein [Saprospiraceae bacterium]